MSEPTFRNPNDWSIPFRRLVCRVRGHRFVEFADRLKRRCARCDREEWVFSNPYPLIGQPKYEWKDMTLRPLRKFDF